MTDNQPEHNDHNDRSRTIMAAAVAHPVDALVPEIENDSDDDFADELEAELVEAGRADDETTLAGNNKKRKETPDVDDAPARKAARASETTTGGGSGLASLPREIIAHVFAFLAPEDLTSVATTCRHLRGPAQDDRLWRRSYAARFGQPKAQRRAHSWRALYFVDDARELRQAVANAPPSQKHLYAQMQAAKRSLAAPAPSADAATARRDAAGLLTDVEVVSRWRASKGLGDGLDAKSKHRCSVATGCSYTRFGSDIFVCERTGRAHVCGDDSCRERVVDHDGMTEMCVISGRVFDRMLGEGDEPNGCGGGGEEAAEERGFHGEKGWLGSCFEAGYGRERSRKKPRDDEADTSESDSSDSESGGE